jgi:environmental stress-induced protein Ves
MIRHISRSDYLTTPWKNGGGITHEILKREWRERLVLRLSVAEVARDGPFSLFPGLTRVLTVVEGRGMDLWRDDGTRLVALPLQPLQFAGDLPLRGMLMDGPCRDFNLMFDASLFDVELQVISAVAAMPDAPLAILYRVDGDTFVSDGEMFPAVNAADLLMSVRPKHEEAAELLTVADFGP